MFYKNRKGIIPETTNWVIATIIIIIILIVSITVASFFGGSKEFYLSRFRDPVAAKSLSAYLLTTDDSGKTIFEQLKENETLNDFNGNLALKVFDELYKENYPLDRWFGINIYKNDYFGSRPVSERGGDLYHWRVPTFSEKIKLKEDKWLELVLMKRK